MDTLRIVVADAARRARTAVKAILNSFGDAQVVGEAAAGTEALKVVEALRPDLALLEVRLPGIGGIEVVRRLPRDHRPLAAFLSVREDQVLDAFDVGALDYLLKPIDASRLRETLDRAWARVRLSSGVSLPARSTLDLIPVRRNQEILLVPLDQVVSIRAEGDLVYLTTIRNERHALPSYRLKALEERLDPTIFLRLSRSTLANVRFIAKLMPLPGGSYLAAMVNQQELTVSRAQARMLRERLFGD